MYTYIYKSDKDTQEYVKKFAEQRGITEVEALRYKVIEEYCKFRLETIGATRLKKEHTVD